MIGLAGLAWGLALLAGDAPAFPDRILGQWTDDVANCGREDTTGVLITRDRISFYEAVGVLDKLDMEEAGLLLADVTYTGEGRTWSEVNSLELSRDETSIRVRALGELMVLERCPAR